MEENRNFGTLGMTFSLISMFLGPLSNGVFYVFLIPAVALSLAGIIAKTKKDETIMAIVGLSISAILLFLLFIRFVFDLIA